MFCLGPPFIKNALGERRLGWKKFGLCDNCYQMLSLSVIQCKETEEERLVKKRREKKTVISAWTSQLLHGRLPCSLALTTAMSQTFHQVYLFSFNTLSLIVNKWLAALSPVLTWQSSFSLYIYKMKPLDVGLDVAVTWGYWLCVCQAWHCSCK